MDLMVQYGRIHFSLCCYNKSGHPYNTSKTIYWLPPDPQFPIGKVSNQWWTKFDVLSGLSGIANACELVSQWLPKDVEKCYTLSTVGKAYGG